MHACSYFLPDRSRTGKQKTPVVKGTRHPKWNHTLVYEDLTLTDLKARCLELTVWNHDKLSTNQLLGGVRLSLGTGSSSDAVTCNELQRNFLSQAIAKDDVWIGWTPSQRK